MKYKLRRNVIYVYVVCEICAACNFITCSRLNSCSTDFIPSFAGRTFLSLDLQVVLIVHIILHLYGDVYCM